VLLLVQAERRLGIAGRLASCIADPRDQGRVIHSLDGILRARILAIACGYEDADDLDTLRHDPGFKLALGKLPDGPVGLASQPTMSRWENAPTTRELVRLTGTLVDISCASYPAPPAAVSHHRHLHGIKTHPAEMSPPGRKRLLGPDKLPEIRERLSAPGATATDVAQELGVARSTLFNYLERYDLDRRAGREKKGVNRYPENSSDDNYVAESDGDEAAS
jgi:hypothetical protein